MAETPYESSVTRWRSVQVGRVLSLALRWQVALALIVLSGGVLRFHGLDWDQPAGAKAPLQMHPDERFLSLVSTDLDWPGSVGEYFDTGKSPLNPYNAPDTHSYVYGTLPLFLGKALSTIAGDDPSGIQDSYDSTVVWGRRLTAGVDTATILLVFFIAATLFGRRAGLAGAGLYALAVLPTQLAHFWTVDPFLTFFGALALLEGVLLARTSSTWRSGLLYAALGITIGLAVASKINGVFFFLLPVTVTAMRWGLRDDRRMGLRWQGAGKPLRVEASTAGEPAGLGWMNDISFLFMSLAFALITFRIAQPYAFDGPGFWQMGINKQWWDDIQRELDFQQGKADYPPFVQWAGRTPFLWPLENMVLWGMGPALGIAAWASVVAAAVLMFRRRELTFLLPLAVIVPIFGFQGSRFVAFMRYFEPVYPALCVLAGWGLVALWGFGRSGRGIPWRAPVWRGRWPRWLRDPRLARGGALACVVVVGGATVWWAMAFQSVYSQEHPRIAASRWIYDNLPAGTRITGEYWDDTLPYSLPSAGDKTYRLVDLEPYMTDSPQKVQYMVYGFPGQEGEDRGRGLDGADYVAISSNRIRDSVKRLEREYPATIRYYELLDSGELGFDLVQTFAVHPTFLGISIDDSSAEESFTVYDHPEVRIYKKTARWDPERAVALLMGARPESAVSLLPQQGRTNGLQYTAAEAAAQQTKGTFTEVFGAGNLFSHAPWLWWLIWLEVAALASVPWVTWLFRALPDRGYGLSKLIGLAAVVLAVWMVVAWTPVDFSATLAWSALAAAVGAGVGVGYLRRKTLVVEAREHWPAWAVAEGVFVAVFFVFLLLRAYNPDLWHHPNGGEKPMEIAYLTAVIRSASLPPYDPWFSGGTMNYYYMGWFFLAVPTRAMRIMPEVAFNLGVPTFASLAAAVAFSSAYNLVRLGSRVRSASGGVLTRHRGAVAAGLLGAFLLVFISNFDPLHQTVERLQAVNEWGLWRDTPVVGGAVGLAGGAYQWAFHGANMPPFDWWRSSRVHFGSFDITEFPYFSFLFADLHPHLMGLPFFGLVIGLAIGYAATVRESLRWRAWMLAVAMGLALGLVRTVHTWDFPTAVLVVVGGVAVGQAMAPGRWQQRWWDAAGHLAVAAGVLVVAFSPYTAHFEVFNSGIQRSPETTEPQQYIAEFGIFAIVALAFLALRYHEELDVRDGRPGRNILLGAVAGPWELGAFAVFVVGLTAFSVRFGFAVIALSAVAVIFLLNLLWLEWRRREVIVGRVLATLMLALAFAIAAGVDIVTVKNDIERMNTVFKFGLQAWQLFALGTAFAAWYVWRALSARASLARPGLRGRGMGLGILRWGLAGLGVFLVLSGSIYLWSGTRERQERRFADLGPTLDGLAYLSADPIYTEDMGDREPGNDVQIDLADDLPIIQWLRKNVEGSPVIVEAVGPLYHWTGRISENTGLPTVIGWDWHQTQQRWDYGGLVSERRRDTDAFWKSEDPETARQFLRKYNVLYVVVGTEEVAHAPLGVRKFSTMPELSTVWSEGQYAIYRVNQELLARGAALMAQRDGTGVAGP